MIAKPHRLTWWASWDYGKVQHVWKYNRFNADYVDSACGSTVWRERLINKDKKERKCKICTRVIASAK